MTRQNFVFTSESVSEGHPDKLCDRISDAVLDAFLAEEANARLVRVSGDQVDDLIWVFGHAHARFAESRYLPFGRSALALNDGASVTHAPTRRRRPTGDKGGHSLGKVLDDVGSRPFFGIAADFANHDDLVCVWIFLE